MFKQKLKILENKNLFRIFFLFSFISIGLVSASLNVQLSDQGTGVGYTNGTTLNSGNLTVLVYTSSSGGTAIYNETFSNAISNGSWNVMLGSGVNLPLEFGKIYYKDYLIVGEDASFDGNNRQAFYSPLGDINGSDLATDFYVNTIGNINTTGNVSVGTILFGGSVNKTLSANSTSIYYYNGTSWIDLTQSSNVTNYWTRNSTTNITSLANVQDNVNLTSSNITTTGTGFFSWLGSLTNRIAKLWIRDINFNGTINGGKINITSSSGNITTSGNLTANDGVFSGNVTIGGNVKITNDLNMTSNNITTVDCITFISGGKICNSV